MNGGVRGIKSLIPWKRAGKVFERKSSSFFPFPLDCRWLLCMLWWTPLKVEGLVGNISPVKGGRTAAKWLCWLYNGRLACQDAQYTALHWNLLDTEVNLCSKNGGQTTSLAPHWKKWRSVDSQNDLVLAWSFCGTIWASHYTWIALFADKHRNNIIRVMCILQYFVKL